MPSKAIKSDAATLSAQLHTQGYLSSAELSILTLPLFTPPQSSSSNVLTAFASYRATHQKAIDQLTKCIWAMVNAKTSQQDTLDQLAAKEQVVQYELERTKALLERERRANASVGREREAEKAKVKEMERVLAAERAKAKAARDELAKSKNMLSYVRTQALHEAKRHELELSAASSKAQKTTNDASLNRLHLLNPLSERTRDERAVSGEVELLETSLAECDEARKEAERECVSLRELVKEIRDWTEDVSRIRGVPPMPAEPKMTASKLHCARPHRADRGEEQGPFPHIVMPCATLRSQTLARLDHLSASFSEIVCTVDDQLISARAELEDLLEAERIGRAEEKARTGEAQRKIQELERSIEDTEARLADAQAVSQALQAEKKQLEADLKDETAKSAIALSSKDNLERKVSLLEAEIKDNAKRQEAERKRAETEHAKRVARAAEKARSEAATTAARQTHDTNTSSTRSRTSATTDENAAPVPARAAKKVSSTAALAGILALGDSPATSAPLTREPRQAFSARNTQDATTPAPEPATKSVASHRSARDIVDRIRREREERQRREAA